MYVVKFLIDLIGGLNISSGNVALTETSVQQQNVAAEQDDQDVCLEIDL
jgi:hypothetical protein